jgi:hypothetical protein
MMNIKRTAEGCRSRRGPRRVVSGRERVLGAEGGALVAPSGQRSKQPSIGKLIDEAMAAIEVANPGLKGVLPEE